MQLLAGLTPLEIRTTLFFLIKWPASLKSVSGVSERIVIFVTNLITTLVVVGASPPIFVS